MSLREQKVKVQKKQFGKTIKAPEGALRVSFNKQIKKTLPSFFLDMKHVYRIKEKNSRDQILLSCFRCVLSNETPNQEKEFSNDRSISSKPNQHNNGLSAKGSAIQILQAQVLPA
jgi:hypothetical protein